MLNDLVALYVDAPILFAGSAFVLGLMIGSFLNVVIYRLPVMLDRQWREQCAEYGAAPAAAAPTHATLTFMLCLKRLIINTATPRWHPV